MTEKSIKDLKEKVSNEDKEAAEEKVKALKEALKKGDIEEIKAKKDELQETAMQLGAKVYEEAAKANEAASEEAEDKKDDVIDAEFEE